MNTTIDTKYVSKFSSLSRLLIWGGLGVCVAAATLYDIGYWVFG